MPGRAHGEGDVAVPADERAAFEVVDAQAGFEFAVVVFDPPADLRQPDQGLQRRSFVHVGQPVLDRSGLARWPFDDQPFLRQAAVVGPEDVSVGQAYPQRQEMRAHRRLSVRGGLSGTAPPDHLSGCCPPGTQHELFDADRRIGSAGLGGRPRPVWPRATGTASAGCATALGSTSTTYDRPRSVRPNRNSVQSP